MKHYKPAIIEVCSSPTSPNQRHYWIIDSTNKGTCRYCGEKKDFQKFKKTKEVKE